MRRSPLAVVCLVLPVFAGSLTAQSWEVQDEVDFAKSLARYRLFAFASEHLDRVGKTANASEDKLALAYGRASVERLAGEHADADADRRFFYQEAITHLTEFINRADDSNDLYDQARSDLADTQRQYGAMLAKLVKEGVDVEANKALATEAFKSAVESLNKIFNANKNHLDNIRDADEEMTEVDEAAAVADAYEPLFLLSATYYDWALLFDKGEFNREDYLNQCIDKSEEYVWEVGTDTLLAFYVYFYSGLAHFELGKTDDGDARLEFIVSAETGLPAILGNPDNEGLPQGLVTEMTTLYERVYHALAAQFNAAGNYQKTIEAADKVNQFYEDFAARGVKPGGYADQFQLELGVARFKSGDAEGMTLLEKVAKKHPNDDIGEKAGEYIAAILSGSDGTAQPVPPSVWLTAAASDSRANRSLDAIDKYHNALGVADQIEDAEARLLMQLDAWSSIGSNYRKLGRFVEAKYAYDEGLRLAKRISDQAIKDERLPRAAIAWYNTLVSRYKETRSRADRDAKDKAMRELKGIGVEDLNFLVAKDDFEQARLLPAGDERKRALQEAAGEFKRIDKKDANYDRSRVYEARCFGEIGDFPQALKKLNTFERYVAKNPPAATRAAAQKREIAHTEGTFYLATYLAETGNHQEVLKTLAEFESSFPNQQAFFQGVNYQRLIALVGVGDLAAAELLFTEAKQAAEAGDAPPLNPSAQYQLATGFGEAAKQSEAAGDADKAREYRTKYANHLYQYSADGGFTSYPNLREVAFTHLQNSDWASAETVLRELIQRFADDPQRVNDINRTIKTRLAEALVSQKKFQDAAKIYDDLLERYAETPSVIKGAALCYGGWLDVKGPGRCEEIPGSGNYPKAVELWAAYQERAIKKEDKANRAPPFWEAKFFTIYTRYRAQATDATYGENAQQLMTNLRTNLLAFYDRDEWPELMGGEDWVQRYEYLIDRLR